MAGMDAAIVLLGLTLAGAGESNHPARLEEAGPPAALAPDEDSELLGAEERRLGREGASGRSDAEVVRVSAARGPGSLARLLLSLAVVLGLIAGGVLLLRRFVPRVRQYSTGQIEMLARTFVSAKQSLALVRVGQRVVLVGIGPESVSCLTVIDDPAEVGQLLARGGNRRRGVPSETFDRYVRQEAAAYSPLSDTDSEPGDPVGNHCRVAGSAGGVAELLDKVKAKLQQL